MYKAITILIIILSISGINNTMGLPDIGISEGLNYLYTGNKPTGNGSSQGQTVVGLLGGSNQQPNYDMSQVTPLSSLSQNNGSWQGPVLPAGTKPTSGSGNKQTSGGNSGGGNKDTSQQDAKNAKLASQIKDSFSSTIDNYKKQISGLPGQQQDSMQQIGNLADSQINSITDALNAALAKYTGYRGEVADNQKQTLQGLADNTRNLFQAGNNYLGTLGAGNSSATGMYSAALTQQANKQRADVQNQTNKQYNDLNVSEQDTNNQFQQSVDQIKTWKATQEATIVSQYQDLKRQLESAYAGAKDNQKGAIANLSMQLANQAQASLSNIGQVASNLHNQLSQGLNTQMGTTKGLVNGVQQNANNYKVGDIVTQDIAGMPNVSQDQQGNYVDNSTGTVFGKKDDGTYQVISA